MPPAEAWEKVRVIAYTTTHKIEGIYFKQPEIRLLDDLNSRKDFIPLTNARISSLLGESSTQLQSDFLALNKQLVLFLASPELKP